MIEQKNKVIIIALDSAEITLIRKWINEGHLPNLSYLIDNGSFGKLKSTADLGSATVWPTFFTGTLPTKHHALGKPHIKIGTYELSHEQCLANKIKRDPFWKYLSNTGRKIAVLDVPGTFPSQQVNGIQLSSWGAHGSFWYQDSSPNELIQEINELFGPYQHSCPEIVSFYGDNDSMSKFCEELLSNVKKKGSLSRYYLDKVNWNLFITVFSESHCAGHNLWHLLDINHPLHENALAEKLGDTILKVYKLIDSEIGTILNSNPNSTYIIFSPEGMGPNYTGSHLLPEILRRIDRSINLNQLDSGDRNINSNTENILKKLYKLTPASRWGPNTARILRDALPKPLSGIVEIIKSFVPEKAWNRAKSYLLSWGNDWRWSRAFCLPSDLNGAIRINLKGREPDGLVNDGQEYEEFCNELIKELSQLINIDTGEKAVSEVIQVNKVYQLENILTLPDLIVKWSLDVPIRGLKSSTIGIVAGENVHDRAGAHTDRGFLIAYGKNIKKGTEIKEVDLVDIAPTVLFLLGQTIPDDLDGNVIMEILDNANISQ